jgi:hypothetical protein
LWLSCTPSLRAFFPLALVEGFDMDTGAAGAATADQLQAIEHDDGAEGLQSDW